MPDLTFEEFASKCDAKGKCLKDVCEDCLNFRQCWSQKAGQVSGLRTAISALDKEAADLFIQGNDSIAKHLRSVSIALKVQLSVYEKELQTYIDSQKYE